MLDSSLSLPSTALGHFLLWSFYGQNYDCRFLKRQGALLADPDWKITMLGKRKSPNLTSLVKPSA
jgi:hypothetical protein